MSLDSLLQKLFGVRTRAVENPKGVVEASTTAQLILSNNPNRLGWTITNLGAEVCYIGLSNAVSATNGIRLDASGGHAAEVFSEDFQEVGWDVWIIAASGTPAIYSKEVVEY